MATPEYFIQYFATAFVYVTHKHYARATIVTFTTKTSLLQSN